MHVRLCTTVDQHEYENDQAADIGNQVQQVHPAGQILIMEAPYGDSYTRNDGIKYPKRGEEREKVSLGVVDAKY